MKRGGSEWGSAGPGSLLSLGTEPRAVTGKCNDPPSLAEGLSPGGEEPVEEKSVSFRVTSLEFH